jgi:hypothetical protein
MIRVVHHGSRIRILTFYPSRIPGSKRQRSPDPDSLEKTTSEISEMIYFEYVSRPPTYDSFLISLQRNIRANSVQTA